MDIFRVGTPANPTMLTEGVMISGIDSATWVERYREPGDFSITGDVGSGLRESLPGGSFISHVDTEEVMVVESHEIKDTESGKEIQIVGRSLETILEQRLVYANTIWSNVDYLAWPGSPARQAYDLLYSHIIVPPVERAGDIIPYLSVGYDVGPTYVGAEGRWVKRDLLYNGLNSLLEIDDLGVRSIRPAISMTNPSPWDTRIQIHSGVDRSASVSFSHYLGDLEEVTYLWSKIPEKNFAVVFGRWTQVTVAGDKTGYSRRSTLIDASDLDGGYENQPSPTELADIQAAMTLRGEETLRASKPIALVGAKVSKEQTSYRFKKDYDVGDLVGVQGEYNEETVMRVSEYAITMDKEGSSEYPTLVTLGEASV